MGKFFIWIGFVALLKRLEYIHRKNRRHRQYTKASTLPTIKKTDNVFIGSQADISAEEIHSILTKRFAYYRLLEEKGQQLFLKRLQRFMSKKIFVIKDDEGFKEMPVLVSAAAIQLMFGLKDYLLPFYKYIRIYPKEYFAAHSSRPLAGNVQHNTISVAWNYFLQGYDDVTDGSNLGLHEMSHAFYIQKAIIEEDYAEGFRRQYTYLITECRKAYQTEVEGRKNIYSDYADTNLQEFWAESVEVFFEKPADLESHYPEVFEAIKLLLNQDPRSPENPVIKSNLSAQEKLNKLSDLLATNTIFKNRRS